MSTMVMTATRESHTSFGRLHLKLKADAPTPIQVLAHMSSTLFTIASEHHDNEDALSLKLQEAIRKIASIEQQIAEKASDEIVDAEAIAILVTEAKTIIKQLRDSILVDDLFGMPLINPVIEGDWIWDEAIFLACKNTYRHLGYEPQSPVTNAPFEAEKKHDFAIKVLGYLSTLPQELLLPTVHEELKIISPEQLRVPEDPEKMKPIETPQQKLATFTELPPETRVALLALWQTEYEERQAERKSLIEGNFQIFQSFGDIGAAKKTLEKAAEEVLITSEVFKRLQEEQKRIAALELEAHRARSEEHTRYIVSTIQAMKKAHRDEKAILNANIASLNLRLRDTEQELAEAQQQIKKDSQRIASLEALERNLRSQLCNMQNQLNDNDGGGCSIM